jgi:hypothetical protein
MKDDELANGEEPLLTDEQDLTPPHGDELREEVTFGRTDRYANVDDKSATRERQFDEAPPPKPVK